MDDTPIKVLMMNDHMGYSGGVIHGVTRYFLSVVPHFDPGRVMVTTCFLRGEHPALADFRAKGLEPLFLSRGKWDPRALTDLVRLVRQLKIDVVHLSGLKSCLLGRLAARMTGCRAVIHHHDTWSLKPAVRFLQRRLARWTDAALAVSDSVRLLMIREYGLPPDRVETLHYGLDLEEFGQPAPGARERVRREFDIRHDAPTMAIIGRLVPEKGHALLMRSMPAVLERCPGAVLIVVGDGPTKSECESIAGGLGIERAVRFAGYRNDVPDILDAVDVVAMPSFREGFGYSALEAIAAGKPVVASRIEGLPTIVQDGRTGFLVEPGIADELIEALCKLLCDLKLAERMALDCRRHAQEFTLDRHVDRLEEIYRRIAGHEQPRTVHAPTSSEETVCGRA
jgi:glycosyltransferase involved in cell wall biosynthesis